MPSGFMLAAPQSSSGKTVLTLAILRLMRRAGLNPAPAKAGPDFIDPAFHGVAAGRPSVNLDPWAMRAALVRHLAGEQGAEGPLIVEAMMGLFDGAADGTGSAADLAVMLGLPIVLIVDAAKQSHSIAALVRGFRDHRQDVTIGGVLLNKVGSPRHEKMLREALEKMGVGVIGAVPRNAALSLPERHLGLVQARERTGLSAQIDAMADVVAASVDLDGLVGLAAPLCPESGQAGTIAPLGQRIAVASDLAFSFVFPHLLESWRRQGVEILPFSPLADESPSPNADAIYLPGGYPELHVATLSNARAFLSGLQGAADKGKLIYGECGGFMVLGEGLIDADGTRHPMAGLLPLVTSFANRKLHLGYRRVTPLAGVPFETAMTAHEFHYSTIADQGTADPVFSVEDARGEALGPCGMRRGRVMGSYMHLIDRSEES